MGERRKAEGWILVRVEAGECREGVTTLDVTTDAAGITKSHLMREGGITKAVELREREVLACLQVPVVCPSCSGARVRRGDQPPPMWSGGELWPATRPLKCERCNGNGAIMAPIDEGR